jgi:hypothetical protein
VARTRAQRRRQSLWLSVALVITLLALLFARDVNRAAHNSSSPRRSENRSFGVLASTLITQENSFDVRFRYLLTNGQTLSRQVFSARLTQLADQLVMWPTEAVQLREPKLAHNVNGVLAQVTEQRFDDYQAIVTDVDDSMRLPTGTLPWLTSTLGVVDTNTAQASLFSTSQEWATRRFSLAREPGHVKLSATTNGVALMHLSSALQVLRTSPTLVATRGVGIVAISVTPAPLPATAGELLLPPASSVHLGISVMNGNYIDQPISMTVTLIPQNGRGLRQSQTINTVLGPLQSFAFVPKLLQTQASERATLIIKVAGAPSALNMTRSRIYRVVMSPSGNT